MYQISATKSIFKNEFESPRKNNLEGGWEGQNKSVPYMYVKLSDSLDKGSIFFFALDQEVSKFQGLSFGIRIILWGTKSSNLRGKGFFAPPPLLLYSIMNYFEGYSCLYGLSPNIRMIFMRFLSRFVSYCLSSCVVRFLISEPACTVGHFLRFLQPWTLSSHTGWSFHCF